MSKLHCVRKLKTALCVRQQHTPTCYIKALVPLKMDLTPFRCYLTVLLNRLPLTRIVSWVGRWPGPPPVFSGLKVDVGLHRKLGLSTYPQRPLGRKRPWFRSICSPGVWKFRATAHGKERRAASVTRRSPITNTNALTGNTLCMRER